MNAKLPKVTVQKELIAKDAMSRQFKAKISIPPYGLQGLEEAQDELRSLFASHPPRSIERADAILNEEPISETGQLSKGEFRRRAQDALRKSEALLSKVPEEHHEIVSQALNQAFLAGSLLAEECLRSRFLEDVTREMEQQEARRKGGASRRGANKQGTEKILKKMKKRIKQGFSKSDAARLTLKDGYGSSVDGNRKIYDYHTKPR